MTADAQHGRAYAGEGPDDGTDRGAYCPACSEQDDNYVWPCREGGPNGPAVRTAEQGYQEDVYLKCTRPECAHRAISHTSGPRGFVYACTVEGCRCEAFLAPQRLGWHVVSGDDLLAFMRRAAGGEDPDLLYAEAWANAQHEPGGRYES